MIDRRNGPSPSRIRCRPNSNRVLGGDVHWRLAIWLRNTSMRVMTAWPMRAMVAGVFEKADAITLRHYGAVLPRAVLAV